MHTISKMKSLHCGEQEETGLGLYTFVYVPEKCKHYSGLRLNMMQHTGGYWLVRFMPMLANVFGV